MQASKDRIALVTPANKGIGFEIARQLGKGRHPILIGARDRDRGLAAAAVLKSEGFAVRYVQIDLTELTTITAAAADIKAQEGRLRPATTSTSGHHSACSSAASVPVGYPADELPSGNAPSLDGAMHPYGTTRKE